MLVMAVGHAFRPLLILSMFCNILRGFCLFNESLSNEITPEYFYLSKFLSTPPNYERYRAKGLQKSLSIRNDDTKLNEAGTAVKTNKLYGLLVTHIILSGDISTNPGPFDLRASGKVKGVSICHWNISSI